MSSYWKKGLVISVILVCFACYSYVYRPIDLGLDNMRLDKFPREIGDWHLLREMPMAEIVEGVLEPDGYIMREYVDSNNERVLLCIVYHQNHRWGAHHPETCYRSSGWDVGGTTTNNIFAEECRVVKSRKFEINNLADNQIVLYWFYASGDKQTGSRLRQMLSMIWNGLIYNNSEGALIRISTSVKHSRDDALSRLDKFGQSIVTVLPKYISSEN
ncbi:MAG: EpsI family protein [Candidatus Scalindua rubra]|uniref:Methanolan biosynthesis EpsI domain-containing protein n=1 Tax=Candidatus Scalindua brodae TaxID=237368 RepID=A0A0B0ECC1_9BACT|nr:MAG: hypothetical protein SCABRO_03386 [Candidatus Scalindua brodae]MBZ0108437.1 EpsI family protein [Candidatus Scalindua rubra]TWU28797.1 hypothetical protein S225a_27600 [Candidatus Brocadiaceae bacterium S225]